jgi:hypothetical protein
MNQGRASSHGAQATAWQFAWFDQQRTRGPAGQSDRPRSIHGFDDELASFERADGSIGQRQFFGDRGTVEATLGARKKISLHQHYAIPIRASASDCTERIRPQLIVDAVAVRARTWRRTARM